MKVILTNKAEITSKKNNQQYVFLSYLDPVTGDCEKVIVAKEVYDSFELDSSLFLSKEELQEFASKAPIADISFNNRGRITDIK